MNNDCCHFLSAHFFSKIFSERFSAWVRDQFIFLIFIISNILLFLFANCGPPMNVSYEWRSLAILMWFHQNLLSTKWFPCAYIWFRPFNIIFFDYHVFIFYLFVKILVFSLSLQYFFILMISALKLYFFVPLIFFIFIAQKLVLFLVFQCHFIHFNLYFLFFHWWKSLL